MADTAVLIWDSVHVKIFS